MYRVSTNALAFATGGTERWRITSSGTLQGSGTISSGAITSTGNSTFSGVIGVGGTLTNSSFGVYLQNNKWYATQYSSSHDVVRMNANTAGGLDIYNQTDNGFANVRVGSLNIEGTTVIDSSRNFINLNSITLNGSLGTWSVDNQGAIMNFSRNTANYIRAGSSSGYLVFQTGGSNTALTLDGNQNATFAGTISSGAITSSSTLTTQADSASAGIKIKRTNSNTGGARGYIGFMDSDNNFVASIDSRGTGVNNSGDLRFFTSTGQSYSGVYNNPSATLILGTDNNATFAGQIHLTGSSSIRSNSPITFNAITGAAQSGKFKSVAAQTSYANGASDGMFNAVNGYAVGTGTGTTVIDSSRNLTNIGTISSGAITCTPHITINASNTSDTRIEVGANTTSNHYAYIDLVSDTTYTDYGLRILRDNSGANASSSIYHRGTGNFNIIANESASIRFNTNGSNALTLSNTQDATFAGNLYVANQIIHRGDINTWMSFETDTISFRTGGNDRLTINNGGTTLGDNLAMGGNNIENAGTISSGAITSSGTFTLNPSSSNNTYGLIRNHDAFHEIILRGIPTNATNGYQYGNQTSFTQYGGDFRFYLKDGTNLTQLMDLDANANLVLRNGTVTGQSGGFFGGDLELYNSSDLIIGSGGAFKFGTTVIVDSSRNLTNIGTISSGDIYIGTADTTNGVLTIHGGGTGNAEGGEIRLGLSADHDGTYDFYRIDTINDDFRIGRSGTTDITLDQSGNTTFEGTITSGAITANHSKSSTANPILALKNTSTTNEGRYLQFTDNVGSFVGQIGKVDQTESNIFISTFDTGLKFESYITYKAILPCGTDGADVDNIIDLGSSSVRFDDIYATNGTIQTSDRSLKQDIQALTDAEQRVATACKGLIRRFRWQDSVAEKDDNSDSDETARYHFGVIAQDLQDAFTAEGLDAGDYGMFISSTWTDDDGVEQTRLGVRYNELLSFIISTL